MGSAVVTNKPPPVYNPYGKAASSPTPTSPSPGPGYVWVPGVGWSSGAKGTSGGTKAPTVTTAPISGWSNTATGGATVGTATPRTATAWPTDGWSNTSSGGATVAKPDPTRLSVSTAAPNKDLNTVAPPPPPPGGGLEPPPPPPPQGVGGNKVPYSPPGYGENWYIDNAYKYNHDSDAYKYWQGVQGQFTGPSSYETNMQGDAATLRQKSAIENLYDSMNSSGEFSRPSQGEDWFTRMGSQFDAPTSGEQTIHRAADELGNTTGAMEDWNKQNSQFFKTQGDAENFYRNNTGALSSQGYTENLANNYQRGPSYNEQFLLGGGATEGLDSLYNRLYQKGSRNLTNEGAARGSFNSGASMRAAEELNSDLGAQHVKDYMAASQAADTSRQADDTYGLNLMQGADTSLRGRLQVGGTLAQNSQAGALGRMTEGGTQANNANSQWLARMNDLANAGNMESTQNLNRLTQGSQAADRATQDWNLRNRLGLDTAKQSSEERRLSTIGAGDLEKKGADAAMDRLMKGGTLSKDADAGYFGALDEGLNAGVTAQGLMETRQNNVADNLLKLGGAQAGTNQRGTDAANAEAADALAAEINGIIDKGGVTSQTIMAKYGAKMKALGLTFAGGKVVAGALTGNPGLVGSGVKDIDPNLGNDPANSATPGGFVGGDPENDPRRFTV